MRQHSTASSEKRGGKLGMAFKVNAVIIVFLLIIMYFVAPVASNALIYRAVLTKWPYVAILLLGAAMVWPVFHDLLDGRRRAILVLISVSLMVILAWIGVDSFSEYLTYQAFGNFAKRSDLLTTSTNGVRYTARQVAYHDMENSITAATEDLEHDDVQPFIGADGSFLYVGQISPDGALQTWTSDNPGYIVYDDRPGVETKVRRVNEVQQIGMHEEWFDNLELKVYQADWWAVYDDPHYLALDPTNPNHFTVAVPKIKYKYFRLPYWAGVVLVHADGKIEDLDREAAMADPRLKNQWIAPQALLKHYVWLQNYAMGYWQRWFRTPGKLEIPNLPGENQFPLLTLGADQRSYSVVATKAEGGGQGLFRMYYGDNATFLLTYYEFDTGATVYGPNAALDRVQNVPGYNWHRETSSSQSGNMITVEPVYIVRPSDQKLFWKFSITNTEYRGDSAVVVVNAENVDRLTVYKERPLFEAWLHNLETVAPTPASTASAAPDRSAILAKIGWHADEIKRLTESLR